MRQSKLTLRIDEDLVKRAEDFAQREGTSLSSMFSRLLQAALIMHHKGRQPGPLTRKTTGLARLPANRSDRELLEEAMASKYQRRRLRASARRGRRERTSLKTKRSSTNLHE